MWQAWPYGRPLTTINHAGDLIVVGGGPPLRFADGTWQQLPDTPLDSSYAMCADSVLLGNPVHCLEPEQEFRALGGALVTVVVGPPTGEVRGPRSPTVE